MKLVNFKTISMILLSLVISIAANGKVAVTSEKKLTANSPHRFKVISIEELSRIISEKPDSIVIYDFNVDSTRRAVGVIPGAHLGESSSDYNTEEELPKDKSKPLVFYCANEMCTASHSAANRAIDAKHSDVSVMIDGIYGWKKAGKKLEPVKWPVKSIEPKEAQELVKNKRAVIVDLREAEERHEIIGNTLWFPTSQAGDSKKWTAFIKTLPADKNIILHCATGIRAKKIAPQFAALGYKTSFFKGPDQWKDQGLEIKQGPTH